MRLPVTELHMQLTVVRMQADDLHLRAGMLYLHPGVVHVQKTDLHLHEHMLHVLSERVRTQPPGVTMYSSMLRARLTGGHLHYHRLHTHRPTMQPQMQPVSRCLRCSPPNPTTMNKVKAGLRGLNPKDLRGVSTPDSDYKILTWNEVSDIVNSNNLAIFQRVPSQLRRYKAFTYQLAKQHGTVANFILNERLRWTAPVTPRGNPFQYPEDIKILYNDWPYGLDSRIIHLVIWTKFELKAHGTGDLTDVARSEIESFVTKTFRSKLPAGNVRTFGSFLCNREENDFVKQNIGQF